MTKIDIYSGFLGAGKTTLIKKMIHEAYKNEKIVLIENEFGEIGIDGGFLQDAGVEITEMNSGCICCSLVGDFGEALAKVISDFAPDRILIEPSGVGKLSDVIKAVEKVTSDEVILGNCVTVADVGKCRMYMKNFGEFYNNQIETAQTILLSRTDDVSEEKLQKAVALIRTKNVDASIITTPWSQLTGEQIFETMERRATLAAELEELKADESQHHDHEHHHDEHCGCGHDHAHGHHHDEHCGCGHDHHHDEHCGCGHDHAHDHHHDEHCGCGHDHAHGHHHDEHCGCGHDHEHGHHHDEHCGCGHDHGHEHHHDEHCGCGHDHEHGHHHADEVFISWGIETPAKFTKETIAAKLAALEDERAYGMVLRAKGYVAGEDDSWIYFDYVPGEPEIRNGSAAVTGRICVIGAQLNEAAIATLFGG